MHSAAAGYATHIRTEPVVGTATAAVRGIIKGFDIIVGFGIVDIVAIVVVGSIAGLLTAAGLCIGIAVKDLVITGSFGCNLVNYHRSIDSNFDIRSTIDRINSGSIWAIVDFGSIFGVNQRNDFLEGTLCTNLELVKTGCLFDRSVGLLTPKECTPSAAVR